MPALARSLAATVFALAPALARADPATSPPVPVMVGGDPSSPACVLHQVIGLDDASVRTAPDAARGREVDRLRNGHRVWACGEAGRFVAVIYRPSPRLPDCGVGIPQPARRAYAGACRSGWIDASLTDIVETHGAAPGRR